MNSSAQTVACLLVVALATGYLFYHGWRRFSAFKAGRSGECDCEVRQQKKVQFEPPRRRQITGTAGHDIRGASREYEREAREPR